MITTNSQQVEIKNGKLLYGGVEVFVEENEPVRVTTSTGNFDVARGWLSFYLFNSDIPIGRRDIQMVCFL